MIKLDKGIGLLSIGSFKISPEISETELKNLTNQYNIIWGIRYGEYLSCYVTNIDENQFSLSILFYKEKLSTINIGLGKKFNFPAFVITEEERSILAKILKLIGGEKVYTWGLVEFCEDRKGGILSIVVKYNWR